MAVVVAAVGLSGRLDRVQGEPDGPVADRVLVHLEAEPVELDDGGQQVGRLEVGQPVVAAVAAVPVAVGLEHRAGEVLQHAVDHDLDGCRVETGAGHGGVRRRAAPLDQVGDLLDPSVPVPPQRPDDPGGQLAVGGQPLVGPLGVRGDPGVLPAGDAERVQVPLRGQDRRAPGVLGGGGHDVLVDPVRRALVQRAGRLAGRRVALDPAVGRVGGVRSMPARCRATELAQAPWTSRLNRKTGRSGTTASSSSLVGVPPGKCSIDQPPPTIHSSSGWRRRSRRRRRGTPRCRPARPGRRSAGCGRPAAGARARPGSPAAPAVRADAAPGCPLGELPGARRSAPMATIRSPRTAMASAAGSATP